MGSSRGNRISGHRTRLSALEVPKQLQIFVRGERLGPCLAVDWKLRACLRALDRHVGNFFRSPRTTCFVKIAYMKVTVASGRASALSASSAVGISLF